MKLAAIMVLLAAPVFGDEPTSGDAFEALVEGNTLTFSVGLAPYGMEYYAPNRQVIWSGVDGECVSGAWYEIESETGPAICFTYENNEKPQCWQVYNIKGQIRADYLNEPGTTVLYEATQSEPLVCSGVGT